MIKNFKKELYSISSNDRISEKLMIFSLYNEFYNDVLGSMDDSFTEHYAPFMEATFRLVIAGLNLQEKAKANVNAEQFMKCYLEMLKINKSSSMPEIKKIIATFKKELSSFIDNMKYVNIIDQFDSIPLDAKVNTMAHFREYINDMYITIIRLYGEENKKELRYDILDMLLIRLEEYLKDSLNQGIDPNNFASNLKSVMMVSTKDYLINKLNNGEFGFEGIIDDDTREFFTNLTELNQKICLMGVIYAIAGYDVNDKSKENERLEEICKVLKISKHKYFMTIISLGFQIMKTFKKLMDGIENDTFDDDYPKKTKK